MRCVPVAEVTLISEAQVEVAALAANRNTALGRDVVVDRSALSEIGVRSADIERTGILPVLLYNLRRAGNPLEQLCVSREPSVLLEHEYFPCF